MPSKKIFAEFLIFIAFLGVIWAFFSMAPCSPQKILPEISIADQEKLGKFFADAITDNKKVNSKVVNEALIQIQKRLTDAIQDSEFTYKIIPVYNEMVNAFALPGGYIIVHSELLTLAETPEEVAAVLAHEIGHIERKHIIKRMVVKLGLEVIKIILTGGDSRVINEAASMMAGNTFDQSQEEDADEFALELLLKAKIDPRNLATFFRRLSEEYEADLPESLQFFSTHPDTNERIQKALAYPVPKDFKEEPLKIKWSKVVNAL
ncbi:MAG: M48 family metallopeptidase [Leptospiraceae bacterium]|nr:M48 family metallopeptidase [Leptospiraceae bacterium]MCB1201727.1 M48 family metallopeptidase [Leptospiraceae bacterium]